jgi:AcrR family transcriptional regulator
MEAPNRCWDGRRIAMQDQGSGAAKTTTSAARQRSGARERERATIAAAMLSLSGELGYSRTSVLRVAERSGVSVGQFYFHFPNRAGCFAAAYEAEAEALCTEMLAAAARQSGWRFGLRAALERLFAFALERPAVAQAILSEVYVAGGDALVKHEEVLERLSHAVDSARREIPSRQAPPPVTATFMVGAGEEFLRAGLTGTEPERLWASQGELMQLIVAPYLGDEVAEQELRRGVAGRPM